MLKGIVSITLRVTRLPVRVDEYAVVRTGLQLCQQTSPYGENDLSTAL